LPINFCDTAVTVQVYCASLSNIFFTPVGDIDSPTPTPREEVAMVGEDACGMVSSFLHIGPFLSSPLDVHQTPEKGK
jgi:hypothetical protein